MKNSLSNPKKNHDYDSALEGDALWSTLEKSPTAEASPTFTQNTVRAARLSQETASSNWRELFMKPKLTLGSAFAVIAIGAFVVFSNDTTSPVNPVAVTSKIENEWLDEALLSTAVKQPDLFTDAEIVAMIF